MSTDPKGSGPPTALDDDASIDEAGEFDELDDVEDEDEDEDDAVDKERRGWPLGTLLMLTVGVWLGRLFYRLPDNLENLAAVVLALATAVFAAGLYRRWVRRQFAQARARRLR